MAMSAFEFSLGATNGYELSAGIAMGVVLPALVRLAFKISSVLPDVQNAPSSNRRVETKSRNSGGFCY